MFLVTDLWQIVQPCRSQSRSYWKSV